MLTIKYTVEVEVVFDEEDLPLQDLKWFMIHGDTVRRWIEESVHDSNYVVSSFELQVEEEGGN
jgi:hypothetical protein